MSKRLLVDGHNIIRACKIFKIARNEIESAKAELIETLLHFSIYYGYAVTVVFDGTGAPQSYDAQNLCIIFSGNKDDADTVIERLVYDSKDRSQITVLTNDFDIRNMIRGMGGLIMESSYFEKLAIDMTKDLRKDIAKRSANSKLKMQNE